MYQQNVHKRCNYASLQVFVIIILMSACSQSADEAVKYVVVKGEKVPVINPEMIQDETEVKFTDWFEDIRLIKLESTPESLLRYIGRGYVCNKYIIVSEPFEGIFMFSPDGKFIRKIAGIGKGPGELEDPNRNIFVDDKNDRLYVTDNYLHPKKVGCYELLTGHHRYIPLVYTGGEMGIRDVIVLEDSLMYCTKITMMGVPSSQPVYCQTTSGRLVWEMDKTHPIGLNSATINLSEGNLYFNYLFAGDTLYRLNNQELKPLVILSSEKPRSYLNEEIGSISMSINHLSGDIFSGAFSILEDYYTRENSNRQMARFSSFWFILDTGKDNAVKFDFLQNDYLGLKEKTFYQIGHNGVVLSRIDALDLIQKADSVLELPDISGELKNRLSNILETIDENDNPYLLVGKMKEKIDL